MQSIEQGMLQSWEAEGAGPEHDVLSTGLETSLALEVTVAGKLWAQYTSRVWIPPPQIGPVSCQSGSCCSRRRETWHSFHSEVLQEYLGHGCRSSPSAMQVSFSRSSGQSRPPPAATCFTFRLLLLTPGDRLPDRQVLEQGLHGDHSEVSQSLGITQGCTVSGKESCLQRLSRAFLPSLLVHHTCLVWKPISTSPGWEWWCAL